MTVAATKTVTVDTCSIVEFNWRETAEKKPFGKTGKNRLPQLTDDDLTSLPGEGSASAEHCQLGPEALRPRIARGVNPSPS